MQNSCKNRLFVAILAILVSPLAIFLSMAASGGEMDQVIAKVNNEPIKASDIDVDEGNVRASLLAILGREPKEREFRQQILKARNQKFATTINRIIKEQAYERLNIEVTEEEARALEKTAGNAVSRHQIYGRGFKRRTL